MPALQAQVLDIGTGCFGDAQPVQREQRDQRMLERWAEPGGDQEPGEGTPFGVGEGGRIVTSAVDRAAVVISHLPAGLEPGEGWACSGPSG